jgi:hypothetical protein
LVLPVGRSILRTLVETAEREGIDVNSLAVGLLMLGLGKQTAFVQARRSRRPVEDVSVAGMTVVCVNCARPRSSPGEARCPVCGGGWCTGFG